MKATTVVRRAFVAAAGLVLSGAGVVIGAAPAGAVDITYNCTAQIGAGVPVTQAVTVNVTAPPKVTTGANFDATIEIPESLVPTTANGIGVASIQSVQIMLPVPAGTALVSAAALDAGVNAPGSTVTSTATELDVAVPGPITGGTSWRPPLVRVTLTATGAAGSSVQLLAGAFNITVNLTGIGPVPVTCPAPAAPVVLATTAIVAPPPPGAPTANPDSASTPAATPVTVNVLANDVRAPDVPIDPASVTVVTPPANGTATVNADGTITYAPSAAFAGTDSLVYQVCSARQPPGPCDTATVTITVEPPPTTTTTTTAPMPSSLPPTGGSGGSLVWLAAGLVLVGGVLIGAVRRRAA